MIQIKQLSMSYGQRVLFDDVRVEASRRYIQACDEIRGTAFTPDTTDPLPRIAKNLGLEAP